MTTVAYGNISSSSNRLGVVYWYNKCCLRGVNDYILVACQTTVQPNIV